MSVGVVLQCNGYVLAYGDSQRVDAGKCTAPCDKTFQFHGVIGCYTGLLAWASQSTTEHIRTILATTRPASASDAVDLLEGPILAALCALPPSWSKRLHVIVATKHDLARVEFDGDAGIALKYCSSNTWMLIGTDQARAAASAILDPVGNAFARFNIAQARMWVSNVVLAAIHHGGQHPDAPNEAACLLPVNKREKR